MARVGVVLGGCGVFDGSEIHEAVSILIALDRRQARIICMAPNVPLMGTVNHLTQAPDPQARQVLVESARIARGNIRDMATVKADELDALCFPGGYGAARNLSTFASDGPNCRVNDQVERLILEMHRARKPMGLACIAPVLAARVLGTAGANPRLTIGSDPATAQAIGAMKAVHEVVDETGICVDQTNRLVSTPCYMNNVGPWVVYQGAAKMVEAVLRMAAAQ
jgi:enhancing lycopene biosynthesis protein 2